MTRPIQDVPLNNDHSMERTGDILTSSYMQHYTHDNVLSGTSMVEEEKRQNDILSDSLAIDIPENEPTYFYDDDKVESEFQDEVNNDYTLDDIQQTTTDFIETNDESFNNLIEEPRRTNRLRQHNEKYTGDEWVNLVKEIDEEKMPWTMYGDPSLFVPEPKGLKAVLRLEQKDSQAFKLWKRAIKAEIKNLIKHGTFSVEEPEKHEKVIPTTLVLKVKLTSTGEWDKAKARICVRGDIQQLHTTEETWSPTSTKRTLRVYLADASNHNAIVLQLDYIGAFLQAPVRSRVFVLLAMEYIRICPEFAQYFGKPLRLIKSMYGQIFCARYWFLTCADYLVEIGFKQSECDNALFIRKEADGSLTKMLIYIDDSLYFNTNNNKDILRKLEKQLEEKFKVEFQGNAHWFLSMRILRDKHGNYSLDQSRHARNIVNKYLGHMESNSKVMRPLPSDWIATKTEEAKDDKEVQALSAEYRIDYPSVIGSFIYLLNTRPDLTFAVTKLAKFMRKPGRNHFKGVIHVLQYLRDNIQKGLKFYRHIEDSPMYDLLKQNNVKLDHNMFGMHDSSWQDCPDTGRSTGAYIIFSQGGPVDFATFVPVPIAMSSAEAEINASANAGMALSHVRMLCNEMNNTEVDQLWDPPILQLCDSSSAVTIINSEKDVKSLRHCKRRLMYSRQVTKEKEQCTVFISNEYMMADIGTKNLDAEPIQRISKFIMSEVEA